MSEPLNESLNESLSVPLNNSLSDDIAHMWTPDARIALYYAPLRSSNWWRAGCEWLGRDAESGELYEHEPVNEPALAALGQSVATLTVAPRRYGWHGTLVAPFHTAEGVGPAQVLSAAREWASTVTRFNVPMHAVEMGHFVALRASNTSDDDAIRTIAASALLALAPLRARPSSAYTERRLASSLTPRQRELLLEWGYPYVFDEFRFHMTLSGALDSAPLRETIIELWNAHNEALGPLPLHGAALFVQLHRDAPFVLWQRLPFANSETAA
jgi:hypothetical protein